MEDRPSGAYRALMDPVAEAMILAYGLSASPFRNHSLPESATISCPGCGEWEALKGLHYDPSVGPHAFAFANHQTKQVIVAFRGACYEGAKRTCRGDMCFLIKHKAYGSATETIFGTSDQWGCYLMDRRKLDYTRQAMECVDLVKLEHPGYQILLVGHSLGGFLAAYVAAKMQGGVQAITFNPLTIGRELEKKLNMSGEALDARANGDILSLCDPYDCSLRSLAEPDSRRGTISCFYDEWERSQVPASCYGMREKAHDMAMDDREWASVRNCVMDSHTYFRYRNITHMTAGGSGSAPLLPTCSSDLNVLSTKVTESMRYAKRLKIGPWTVRGF